MLVNLHFLCLILLQKSWLAFSMQAMSNFKPSVDVCCHSQWANVYFGADLVILEYLFYAYFWNQEKVSEQMSMENVMLNVLCAATTSIFLVFYFNFFSFLQLLFLLLKDSMYFLMFNNLFVTK